MRAPLKPASDSAFGDTIEGRTHPISPTDPRTIEKMIGWLEEADERDGDFISSSRLPSRLLKITEGGATISLVKPTDETTKYAALSHCWGSVRLTTLSTDSFDQLKNGVRTSSLPQSFQDAVWVTHLLGAQYLWIDSLCIFQDSLQDWTHESAKMCDIYENSWLTIAASRASSSIQGFLGNQERPDCTSIAYRQGSVSEEIQISTVPIRQACDSERNANLNDEPLTGRGWALQERFLPRRILHFSRSQILFEHHGIIWAQDKRGPIHLHYASRGIEGPASWHRLVEQFTTRRLTKETDKLPAIGGLAAYFAPFLSYDEHSTYLAGLWRKDLLAGLCWSLDPYCTPGPSPKSYRAPSWSWASIDGKVTHSHFSNELAIIEEAHTSLLSPENPFGEVQAGWIRLRAIVLRPSSHRPFNNAVFRFSEEGNKFYISVTWDSEPCSDTTTNRSADLSEDETGLHFMPMLWNKSVSLTDNTIFGPKFIVMKRFKHVVAQHSILRGFERLGFGTALSNPGNPGEREGLFKLVSDGWTKMMLTGQLEEIILV